jgi:hypothetical protein
MGTIAIVGYSISAKVLTKNDISFSGFQNFLLILLWFLLSILIGGSVFGYL